MNSHALFERLQQLTGRLTAAPDAPEDALSRFEGALAAELRVHPDLVITGNRLAFESIEMAPGPMSAGGGRCAQST